MNHGLFYSSPTSPFARKVRIVMRLRDIAGLFDEIDCDPFFDEPHFLAANPVGQVPALMSADGENVIGSALICAFLDRYGAAPAIASGEGVSWEALRRQAVADGVMECSVRLRAERMLRKEGERSDYWMDRWKANIARGLDHLEATLPHGDQLDIGVIATLCSVLYLDLRHPDLPWRAHSPALAACAAKHEHDALFARTAASVPIPNSNRLRGSSDPLP